MLDTPQLYIAGVKHKGKLGFTVFEGTLFEDLKTLEGLMLGHGHSTYTLIYPNTPLFGT